MLRACGHLSVMVTSAILATLLGSLYAGASITSRPSTSDIRVAAITCTEQTKNIGDKSDYCAANQKLCDPKYETVTLTSNDKTENGKTTADKLVVWEGGNAPLGKVTFDFDNAPAGCKTITNYLGPCSAKSGKQFTTSNTTGNKAWLEELDCPDSVWSGPCSEQDQFAFDVHIPASKLADAIKLGLPIDEAGYCTVSWPCKKCALNPTMMQQVRCDGGGNTTYYLTPEQLCPGEAP